MRLIAHDIRSLHNVGSLFRTADAFGVERVYLTGFTGTPPRPEIAKTALGAEDRVAWEHREDIVALIRELQASGMPVYALETGEGSVPINEMAKRDADAVLIVGNEVAGLEERVLKIVDTIVEIPMPGRKKSLNVSVAAGIAIYAFGRK